MTEQVWNYYKNFPDNLDEWAQQEIRAAVKDFTADGDFSIESGFLVFCAADPLGEAAKVSPLVDEVAAFIKVRTDEKPGWTMHPEDWEDFQKTVKAFEAATDMLRAASRKYAPPEAA